jgi:DNA-3-methyladenine glycosylase II
MQKIITHLKKDKKLAPVIKAVYFTRIKKQKDIYVVLLRAIVSQQLSTKAADTIWNRFIDLFPDKYPHPKKVVKLSVEKMRGCGLSFQKAGYIKNIAEFDLKHPDLDKKLEKLSNEEVIEFLTQIKGVGKWTVEMILMFAMGRPDVFSIGDLVLRNSVIDIYKIKSTGKKQLDQIEKIAEAWSPYRSYACTCLWKYKDSKLKK